ncbi:MAG TPA: hypothetical protein VM070_07600 [Candidatus Saccharimonadales bacterium]|nr:hypothetical protein [Candidatus Saccharimonadales bacterium]
MNDVLGRKQHRQQALLRLVTERPLRTQGEVARALRAAGFPATQATVSRDIVELGLIKTVRGGGHAYAPPSAASVPGGAERLRRFCEDYPVESCVAGTILVLRTSPGTANALAIALDTTRLDDLVGTLAGDDTVFLATTTAGRARALAARLAGYGVRVATGKGTA